MQPIVDPFEWFDYFILIILLWYYFYYFEYLHIFILIKHIKLLIFISFFAILNLLCYKEWLFLNFQIRFNQIFIKFSNFLDIIIIIFFLNNHNLILISNILIQLFNKIFILLILQCEVCILNLKGINLVFAWLANLHIIF